MSRHELQKSYWRDLEFKVIVATVLIVTFFVILIIGNQQERARRANQIREMNPIQDIGGDPDRFPAPQGMELPPPLYPPPDWADSHPLDTTGSGLSGATITGKLPDDTTLGTKTEPRLLPTPTTQVHSLSEAAAVMGPTAGEGVQVGVTTVHKLPDQSGLSKTSPLDGSSLETPAGIPSSEAGRKRVYPPPRDPEQP